MNHYSSPQPSVPHSCAGEIWSGLTQIDQHVHTTLLVHSNSLGSSEEAGSSELVSAHLLGLAGLFDSDECHAVFFSVQGGVIQPAQGEYCSSALPLPVMRDGDWSLVYTSPILRLDEGRVSLALIGETGKMVAVSRERIAHIEVIRESVAEILRSCSPGGVQHQSGGEPPVCSGQRGERRAGVVHGPGMEGEGDSDQGVLVWTPGPDRHSGRGGQDWGGWQP